MGIELQIRADSVADLMTSTLARRLGSTCLPQQAGFSIDHIDVVPNAASVVAQAVGLVVQVPVDVYIVTDVDLVAAANATPAGATVPAARVTVSFTIDVALEPAAVDGRPIKRSFLRFTPLPFVLPPLPPVPGLNPQALEQKLRAALPSPQIELTAVLAQLGLTAPQQAGVTLVDDTVAARFDTTGNAQGRLFPGQDWGLYVEGSTAERIVVDRLSPPVMRALPDARVKAHYETQDGAPRVIVEVDLSVVGAFVGHPTIRFAIDLGATLSLVPPPAPLLRVSADWSFHIVADLVPGFLESLVESFVSGIAEDLIDPQRFGATRTGDRSFVYDLPLPPLDLPGVYLRYDSVLGSADGMTLGGAVLISRFANAPFKLTVSRLGSPLRIQLCSQLARTGSGARSPEPPSIFNTRSYAQVQIDGSGALCAIEQRTPSTTLASYLTAPPLGSTAEPVTLLYVIPYAVALNLPQPLTLVVRTARGVRFVDLGRAPSVRTDAAGVLLGASRDYYIKDCLNVVARDKGAYGLGWGLTTEDVKTPPIETPDWAAYLQQLGAGLVVQMVRVQELDAGEWLRFRSASHTIEAVADARGQVTVPVMLPLLASAPTALLTRANGRTLEGHIDVDSVAFERHVTLPGRLVAPPMLSGSGGLRLATHSRRETLVHTVSTLGAGTRAADSGEATELNPELLQPVESPSTDAGLLGRTGLLGLDRIVAVPGFSDVAVAVMTDGSKLLLDVSAHGAVRVAGVFAGPIGEMTVEGSWAVAQTGDTVAVFRTARRQREDCSCDTVAGREPQPAAWR